MENKDRPIYPCMMQQIGDHEFRLSMPKDDPRWHMPMAGLTKREYFAAMALQGKLSQQPSGFYSVVDAQAVAMDAVKLADALLAELEKTQP